MNDDPKIQQPIQIFKYPKNDRDYYNKHKSNEAMFVLGYTEYHSMTFEIHKDVKEMNQMIDSKQGH